MEALDGRPGVYAARYAGEGASYADNCHKLLKEMQGVPPEQRGARFITVMALAHPEGQIDLAEGVLEGRITEAFQGSGGFGYDPVFYVPSAGKTLADMTFEEKNQLSHRGLAVQKAKHLLMKAKQL